jgi:hypothetical protein
VKNIKKRNLLILILFLLFSFRAANAAHNFQMWIEGTPRCTIGKEELINIYVKNTGTLVTDVDSYTVNCWSFTFPNPNLINVNIPSDRILSIKPNQTGNTFATAICLAPFTTGGVGCRVTSDATGTSPEDNIDIKVGYPITLSEFGLIGIIELLILASLLVVSYSSHFR